MGGINPQISLYNRLPYLPFSNDESPINFDIAKFSDYMAQSAQMFPNEPASPFPDQLNQSVFSSAVPTSFANFQAFPSSGNSTSNPFSIGGVDSLSSLNMQSMSTNPFTTQQVNSLMPSGAVTPMDIQVGDPSILNYSQSIMAADQPELAAYIQHIDSIVNPLVASIPATIAQAQALSAMAQMQQSNPFAVPGGDPTAGSTGTDATTSTSSSSGNGSVDQWVDQAVAILEQQGVPASQLNKDDIKLIIMKESGGNPNAVNNWDSNAKAGTPSKGLMQTIQPTFDAHALPGHTNILNPVDNIIAGVRYAISRYGSVSNVPGVKNVHQGLAYVGY
jgi:hypothetical protein